MDVAEAIHYSHLNKQHQNKLEQSQKTTIQQAVTSAIPTVTPLTPDEATNLSKNPLQREENEVLRMLILYGERMLTDDPNEGTVGEYIVQHIKGDELYSIDPIYTKIINLYDQNFGNPDFVPIKFFTQHSDLEVNQLAVSVTTQPHTLSEIHSKRGKVTDEADILALLVPRVILELQGAMVKVLLKEVLDEIQLNQTKLFSRQSLFETTPTEELREEIALLNQRMSELLAEHSLRVSIQNQIAKRLGERIVLK